jgi:SAM-dependent methyltransferase
VGEDRPADLLKGVSRSSKILELGPSVSPMAPRSAGWDVTVIDHATQEELIEKYRHDPNVNVANIEKVDFVWSNGPLHELVPADQLGTFDVLIASHVIEHLPDPIGFMNSAAKLLHPERGVLALAVPDKRWCFDYFKQVSSTGQFFAAHRLGAQRHSPATRFDHSAYIAFDHGRGGWGRERLTGLKLADTLDHAFTQFQSWTDDPAAPYVDCHAWHFTPASFALLVLEAGAVGLLDWRVEWLRPRSGVEFFVRLVRGREEFATPADRENRRLELLKQILLDLREQTDWLVDPSAGGAISAPIVVDGGFDAESKYNLQQIAATVAEIRASTPVVVQAGFDEEAKRDLQQIAETAAAIRTALRPGRAIWHQMLPLRRTVARLRGRI